MTTTVTVTVGFGGAVTVLTGAVTVFTGAVIVLVAVGTAELGGAGSVGAGRRAVVVGAAIVVLAAAEGVLGTVDAVLEGADGVRGGVDVVSGVRVMGGRALVVVIDVGPASVTVAVLAGTAEGDRPPRRGMARPRRSAAGTANHALLSR